MTRKDYVAIAAAVKASFSYRGQNPDLRRVIDDAVIDTARKLSSTLAADNPRFDRSRFLKACGVTQ